MFITFILLFLIYLRVYLSLLEIIITHTHYQTCRFKVFGIGEIPNLAQIPKINTYSTPPKYISPLNLLIYGSHMSEYSYIGYSSDKIVICLIIICLHRYSYMNRHMIIPLNHIWVHMSVHILILIYVTHISVTYMNSLILIYEYTCMSTHICVHIYVYSYMSIKMLISLLIYDPNIWVPIYDYHIWVLIYMTTIWYSYMSHVLKNTYDGFLQKEK